MTTSVAVLENLLTTPCPNANQAMLALHDALEQCPLPKDAKRLRPSDPIWEQVLRHAPLWEVVCSSPMHLAPLLPMILRADRPELLHKPLANTISLTGHLSSAQEAIENCIHLHYLALHKYNAPQCARVLAHHICAHDKSHQAQVLDACLEHQQYADVLSLMQHNLLAQSGGTAAAYHVLANNKVPWNEKRQWLAAAAQTQWDPNSVADPKKHLLWAPIHPLPTLDQCHDLLHLGVDPHTRCPSGETVWEMLQRQKKTLSPQHKIWAEVIGIHATKNALNTAISEPSVSPLPIPRKM